MSTTLRCKVPRRDGVDGFVDGCGYEMPNASAAALPRVDSARACPKCPAGILLVKGEARGERRTVGMHPALGAPYAPDRMLVLESAAARLKALMYARVMYPDASPDEAEAVLRETIALLQSLLPASAAADAQAQLDTIAAHVDGLAVATDEQALALWVDAESPSCFNRSVTFDERGCVLKWYGLEAIHRQPFTSRHAARVWLDSPEGVR